MLHFLKQQLPGIPVRFCLFVTLALHISSAWFSEGYHNPDEHFQILEFANYKLGRSAASELAWEFPAKIRPSVQPAIAYAVYRALDIFHMAGPFTVAFLLRLLTVIAAWFATIVFCIVVLPWLSHGIMKKTLFLFSGFFWFFPYYHCRFSSENWAGIAFFAGLTIILWSPLSTAAAKPGRSTKFLRFLTAGFLFGFAFFFRFQMAFAIIGMGLWLIVFKKASLTELCCLFAAFCVSCGINIGIDRWFYGSWVLTPANYFYVNIIKGVSSSEFGVSPWWYYAGQLLIYLVPPLSLLVVAAFFVTWYKCPKNPLVWISIPFFLLHCIIGHKEFRFLFPMMYVVPALLVLGLDSLRPSIVSRFRNASLITTMKICLVYFVAVNATLLLGYTFKPGKEIIKIYRWIYKTGASEPFSFFTLGPSPYCLGTLQANFYRPPHVTVIPTRSADSLKQLIGVSKKPIVVATMSFMLPDSLKDAAIEWKVECRSIPQWLSHFDINHWLSRVRIWSIFTGRRLQPANLPGP
jgi:GPI mannosyltransferase 3